MTRTIMPRSEDGSRWAAWPREHGSRRGYTQHRVRGEAACADCLAASSDEEKRRRLTDPEYRDYRRAYIAARGRVLTELARRYPCEMAALLREELGADDVTVRRPYRWTCDA